MARKSNAGRPPKFNADIAAQILGYLSDGAHIETVAYLAGIDKDTFYDWAKKGAHVRQRMCRDAQLEREGEYTDEELLYFEFSEGIKKAIATSELSDMKLIERAAIDGQWQAAAWRLERRWPQRYGRVEKRINANLNATAKPTDLTRLTDNELDQLETLLDKAALPDGGPGGAVPALPDKVH